MNNGTITKILLVVMVVGISMGYIRPAWEEIGERQDTIYEIDRALENAEKNNQELTQLLNQKQRIDQSSLQTLSTFLPASIDYLQLMADIAAIAQTSGVAVVAMNSSEVGGTTGPVVVEEQDNPLLSLQSGDVTLTVAASYEQLKQFLARLERNDTFLEVVALTIGAETESIASGEQAAPAAAGTYTLTLRTYARSERSTNPPSN